MKVHTRRSAIPLIGAGLLPNARIAPEAGDMSRDALDAGLALYRGAVEAGVVAGVVLLVARQGSIILHQALGWRDVERRLPMENTTLFRMASNTKPVIATAVLMLQEAGKLSLDDSVAKYLPSFDSDRGRGIRIRHLLAHTSGMRIRDAAGEGVIFLQPLLEKSVQHPDAPSLQAEVSRFGAIGAEVLPGTAYSYSDPGYNTLGAVIEAASGQALGAFLEERIYVPLGMRETSNHESRSPNERMAVVYKASGNGGLAVVWKPGDRPAYPFVRASCGMISSATDYLRFCRMFLNGGELDGKRILSPASVRSAVRPAPNTGHPYRGGLSWYGFGWELFAGAVYGHHGSDGTFAWIDPATGVIALVLTQTQRGSDLRVRFLELVQTAARRPR
ncbi:MAG: serine hydrolase [Acidobacteria bacterium]|nr:serine hydrolase [Acidobacteriota bacterium]